MSFLHDQLQAVARPKWVLYRPVDFRGPACLAAGSPESQAERMIGEIMARYRQEQKGRYFVKKQIVGKGESLIFVYRKLSEEEAAGFQIGGFGNE
jgi:hypothetical protein